MRATFAPKSGVIERLRCWLIRRLGGYVSEYSSLVAYNYVSMNPTSDVNISGLGVNTPQGAVLSVAENGNGWSILPETVVVIPSGGRFAGDGRSITIENCHFLRPNPLVHKESEGTASVGVPF